MNADGTNQTRITTFSGVDARPSWSRELNKIVFASTRDAGNWDIYMMNPDGSGVVRLTNAAAIDDYPFIK